MEVFTNCATAIASFAKFYLLLNGSGVGRAYDDALIGGGLGRRARRCCCISRRDHPDYPARRTRGCAGSAIELGLLPWDAPSA